MLKSKEGRKGGTEKLKRDRRRKGKERGVNCKKREK